MAVCVPVIMVRVAVDDFGCRWLAAAINGGAVGDFHLDGCVADPEVIAQLMIQALEN